LFHYDKYGSLKEKAKNSLSKGPASNVGSDAWEQAQQKRQAAKEIGRKIQQENTQRLRHASKVNSGHDNFIRDENIQDRIKDYSIKIPKPKVKPEPVPEPDTSHIDVLPGSHLR